MPLLLLPFPALPPPMPPPPLPPAVGGTGGGTVPIRCTSNVCEATDLNTGFANNCSRVGGSAAFSLLLPSLSFPAPFWLSFCPLASSSNAQHNRSTLTNKGTASAPGPTDRLCTYRPSSPPAPVDPASDAADEEEEEDEEDAFFDGLAGPAAPVAVAVVAEANEAAGKTTSNCQWPASFSS